MQHIYVYGDLQVSLTLQADNESLFGRITNAEYLVLGQWLYLTLNCFSNSQAIRQLDSLDKRMIKGVKGEMDKPEKYKG